MSTEPVRTDRHAVPTALDAYDAYDAFIKQAGHITTNVDNRFVSTC